MSSPVPVSAINRGRRDSDAGGEPPLGEEDFDHITDFFMWDSEDPGRFEQAFCVLDEPYMRPVFGSPVGDRLREVLTFIQQDKGLCEHTDFQVVYKDKYVFRGHRERTVEGVQICLRRIQEKVPRLQDLILPPFWREILNSETLTPGGLVILGAKPGSGKSTTIGAMVRSRLEKFAGFCKTIEAPPELPLQNSWGRGVCFQIPVDESADRDKQFANPLRALLRGYPSIPGGGRTMLVVGETRDPETAAEVVHASVGHLVITTMHALDVETTVSRFCSMAGKLLGTEVAREMTASALRVVANMSLEKANGGGNGWHRRRAVGELLYSGGASSSVANRIRKGDFSSLLGEAQQQGRRLRGAADRSEAVDQVLESISPNVRKESAAV
jgi:Tfp pilus assembly pilus retraction ATPase PilT